MTEIDATRLWLLLGKLEESAKANETRHQQLLEEVRALRTSQEEQRRDHERLVNRGAGVLIGVGALAGGVGASLKQLLFTS